MARPALAWLWLGMILLVAARFGHANIEADSSFGASHTPVEGAPDHHGQPESSRTREALAHLRTIKASGDRSFKMEKKSGILGAAAYYAKKGFVLLFMNGPQESPLATDKERTKLGKPLAKAVELLEDASREHDEDALFILAEMNFHGNYSHPRDYKRAFQLYHDLATRTGNSTAQHMVGFMYATGIGDAVEKDQAKALLYHTFAAHAGDIRSEMTVAFRHHSGIGTPSNCHEAVVYYKRVADKAIAHARSGPPGGLPLMREAFYIADDDGGVYGDGASYSSSGNNAHRGGPGSDQHSPFDDVMEFLDLLSRKGDLKATFGLGKINYDGTRTIKRNYKTSRKYFMQIANQYWDRNGRVVSDDSPVLAKYAAKAAAHLGRFSLRGEGVPQNFDKALRWFKLGVSNGDPYCQYETGLMYLLGLGVKKDVVVASNYFKESAQQDWPAAQVNLGKLFLDQGDLKTAATYFELALRHGHIEAFYHLAEINHFGVGRERSCETASSYYKVVAEKVEALHSSFDEANQAYEEGDRVGALVSYMMAAEQGYEQAQANVAYLLDEHKSILSLDRLLPWKASASHLLRNAALALVYWTRSSKQFNIDSTVKMGDYYLRGYGVAADVDKAAQCYQSAAETHQSAQALWNLGWMHENGLGVDQDFHLASRLYEEAAEANTESYLPVKLSLLKLRVRSYWNQLTDGKVNPIQPEPEKQRPRLSWSEWLAHFLAEDAYDGYYDHPDDYIGEGMPGGDELYLDDLDAHALETVTLLALALALAALVYYRQLRTQDHARAVADAARRREQPGRDGPNAPDAPHAPNEDGYVVVDEGDYDGGHGVPGDLGYDAGIHRDAQQADGGFFPPPDDPNFDAWRVGGVGH